jgi:hypothetical protein
LARYPLQNVWQTGGVGEVWFRELIGNDLPFHICINEIMRDTVPGKREFIFFKLPMVCCLRQTRKGRMVETACPAASFRRAFLSLVIKLLNNVELTKTLSAQMQPSIFLLARRSQPTEGSSAKPINTLLVAGVLNRCHILLNHLILQKCYSLDSIYIFFIQR